MDYRILEGDCVERMRELDEASVGAIVCDPPYGIGFMGKEWDGPKSFVERKPAKRNTFDHVGGNHNPTDSRDAARTRRVEARKFQEWSEVWATEALRVLKPGGHLLAFGGTRTYHRLACAIEDAGFEIRDSLLWLYGGGFPKSHNLDGDWQGWGTALKPAHEPTVVARKPLVGTVAENVLTFGTGAINIDACRIESAERWEGDARPYEGANGFGPGDEDGWSGNWTKRSESHPVGRWPANVVLDPEAAAMLDEQSGERKSAKPSENVRYGEHKQKGINGVYAAGLNSATPNTPPYGDTGGASRFFYCAKASPAERNAGLEGRRNVHPTVKPIELMRWLVRLVTPPGGTVLDPFAGSGTTGCAAVLEGFDFIGIEREAEYAAIARARIEWWAQFEPGTETDAALGLAAREREQREAGQASLLDRAEAP